MERRGAFDWKCCQSGKGFDPVDFENGKFNPDSESGPLRDQRNQEILWNGLRDGLVQTVATNHAPFDFKTQKPMGKDDFTKIPNGNCLSTVNEM